MQICIVRISSKAVLSTLGDPLSDSHVRKDNLQSKPATCFVPALSRRTYPSRYKFFFFYTLRDLSTIQF